MILNKHVVARSTGCGRLHHASPATPQTKPKPEEPAPVGKAHDRRLLADLETALQDVRVRVEETGFPLEDTPVYLLCRDMRDAVRFGEACDLLEADRVLGLAQTYCDAFDTVATSEDSEDERSEVSN